MLWIFFIYILTNMPLVKDIAVAITLVTSEKRHELLAPAKGSLT